MTKYSLKSKYVRFAKAYCDRKRLFIYNERTKKREYNEMDIWEGILTLQDFENRNRGKK